MAIKELDVGVKAKLRSSCVINSALTCVKELVHNSLDANAEKIMVRVSLKRFYVEVADNGCGVTENELEKMGQMYNTNKCNSAEDLDSIIFTYGYRGCALASIANVCRKMEIRSRVGIENLTTHKKIFTKGVAAEVKMCEITRAYRGTSVYVSDLFVDMPVRRLQCKESFDIEQIRQELQMLSILHDKVSISLRNDDTGKVIFESDSSSIRQDINCLVKEGLTTCLSGSHNGLRVSGIIGKHLHRDSSIQLVYINQRLVRSPHIHQLVVKLMEKYGGFWNTTHCESDPPVDVNGYVYLIRLLCPYEKYYATAAESKAMQDTSNLREMLILIELSLKKAYGVNSISRSITSSNMKKSRDKVNGNHDFGPSQLKGVIHGQKVSRKLDFNPDGSDHAQDVTQNVNSTDKENLDASKIGLEDAEGFFQEEAHDGSMLAENIPLYELPINQPVGLTNVPETGFHEFMAWLQLQASEADACKNFLNLFKKFKMSDPIVKRIARRKKRPIAPTVSIKQKRSERVMSANKKLMSKIPKCFAQKRRKIAGSDFGPRLKKVKASRPSESNGFQVLSDNEAFPQHSTWMSHYRQGNIEPNNQQDYVFTTPVPVHPQEKLSYPNPMRCNRHMVRPGMQIFKTRPHQEVPRMEDPLSAGQNEHHCISIRSHGNAFDAENHSASYAYLNRSLDSTPLQHLEPPSLAYITPRILEVNEPSRISSSMECFPSLAVNETTSNAGSADILQVQPSPIPQCSVSRPRACVVTPTYNGREEPSRQHGSIHGQEDIGSCKCDACAPSVAVQTSCHRRDDKAVGTEPMVTCDEGVQAIPETKSIAVQTDSLTEDSSDYRLKEENRHDAPPSCSLTPTVPVISDEVTVPCKTVFGQHCAEVENFVDLTIDSDSDGCGETPQVEELTLTQSLQQLFASQEIPCAQPIPSSTTVVGKSPFFENRSAERRSFDSFKPQATSSVCYLMEEVIPGVPIIKVTSKPSLIPRTTMTPQNVLQEMLRFGAQNHDGVHNAIQQTPKAEEGTVEGIINQLEEGASGGAVIPIATVRNLDARIEAVMNPVTVTKESLENIKVLGQLDKKFIVGRLKMTGTDGCCLLLLFDQHAVHERINLETLMKKYMDSEEYLSEKLKTSLVLRVARKIASMVTTENNVFKRFGLDLSVKGDTGIVVNAVPTCFLRREERELHSYRGSSLKKVVMDLIDEISLSLLDTKGLAPGTPKCLYNVIAAEACRSAIQFNTVLSFSEMKELIANLQHCNLPFQCAHGRPAMVTLTRLPESHRKRQSGLSIVFNSLN